MESNPPVGIEFSLTLKGLHSPACAGIERIDRIYADHFLRQSSRGCCAVVQSWPRPAFLSRQQAQTVLRRREALAADAAVEDAGFISLCARLFRESSPTPSKPAVGRAADWRNFLLACALRLPMRKVTTLPRGSVYLNVSQHHLFSSKSYRWLDKRGDLIKIFMLHDLLPLDYPEYWEAGHRARFDRSVDFVARRAPALITPPEGGRRRIAREMRQRGRDGIPIHVAPFPSPLAGLRPPDAALVEKLKAARYFLMIGTIEPRKNHLLILHLYRALAHSGAAAPRLVLVGGRGWENEQVLDLVERCESLRDRVIEVSNLSPTALACLIGGANALLVPSFDEGYGLPIVEALTLGVPVVASNRETFREVSQGCATFIDPTDGPGWTQALIDLGDAGSAASSRAGKQAAGFSSPEWSGYFHSLEKFIATLRTVA